jgi:type II secretory pathway pseudopilin PulG
MSPPRNSPPVFAPPRQRGQAMMFVAVLLLVGVFALIFTLADPANRTIESDKKTAAALALAKEALIGRAAADDNRPGSLPCPDLETNIVGTNVPNDGIADLLAGNDCPSYIGRLPWRTLGLPDLRDGDGERLWYALSTTFRDDTSAQPINSDTAGQLTITGTTPDTSIIAIVFSPGAVVGSQVRDVANENAVANYLENGNETGIATNTFVSGQAASDFNDRLLAITSDALFPLVEMRVIREIRQSLLNYRTANGYYPYASSYSSTLCSLGNTQGRVPLTITFLFIFGCVGQSSWGGAATLPTWFSANNWNELIFYAVSSDCISLAALALCNLLSGAPLTVGTTSAQALLISAGRTLPGQTRPCPDSSSVSTCAPHYLDNVTANTDGNSTFTVPVSSSTNNDRLLIVSP